MSSVSQPYTPLWILELSALRVPPLWAVWVLLWLVDHYAQSEVWLTPGLVGCQAALCGGACHWLVGVTVSQAGWLWNPGGNPKASDHQPWAKLYAVAGQLCG